MRSVALSLAKLAFAALAVVAFSAALHLPVAYADDAASASEDAAIEDAAASTTAGDAAASATSDDAVSATIDETTASPQDDAALTVMLADPELSSSLPTDGIIVPESISPNGAKSSDPSDGKGIPEGDLGKANTYLVLGDSISTGYQPNKAPALTDTAFFGILAKDRGYVIDNHAIVGNTSDVVRDQVTGKTLDTDIKCASLITITLGGNDLMHALYKRIAEVFNAYVSTYKPIDADDVTTILSDPSDPRYMAVEMSALIALQDFTTKPLFQTALQEFGDNLEATVTYIHKLNPDATIVVETQYNPYTWLSSYSTVTEGIEKGAVLLNDMIVAKSKDANGNARYLVADSYAAFAKSTENLTCATNNPLSLDFHPNEAGHAVIAQTMEGVMLPMISCSAEPATGLVSNGTDQSLGSVSVDVPASGATVSYGASAGDYSSTEALTQTAAGTYTTYYRVTAPGYEAYMGCFTTSIKEAPVVPTPTPTPEPTPTPAAVVPASALPNTGDDALAWMLAALAMLGLGCGCTAYGKRQMAGRK